MVSWSEAAGLALVVGKQVTEKPVGPLRRASPPRPASFKPLAIGLVVFPHTQLSVEGPPRLFSVRGACPARGNIGRVPNRAQGVALLE